MYGEPQAFGHFGAPDVLNPNYGTGHSMLMMPDTDGGGSYEETGQYDMRQDIIQPQGPVDVTKVLTPATYKRNSKRLPFVKGGATDAGVKSATGIEGLITEIQASMTALGVSTPKTGTITTSQIKAFQTAQGLTSDGVIGQATYTKLGFTAPYPKSSSSGGGGTYNPKTDAKKAIGAMPFYKKKWVQYTALGVVVVATGFLLFYPRGDE